MNLSFNTRFATTPLSVAYYSSSFRMRSTRHMVGNIQECSEDGGISSMVGSEMFKDFETFTKGSFSKLETSKKTPTWFPPEELVELSEIDKMRVICSF